MELVFAADLHLAANTWKRLPSVCGDSYRAFEQIVSYCADHKDRVAALVLGGDIFDSKPDSSDVSCFLKGVRLLTKLGIRICAIQGQHGRNRELPWTSIDPYVLWLHGTTFELPGPTVIAGVDNMPPDELQARIKALDPAVDILVLHQKCKGCLPDIGDQVSWDFDPDWLPEHVKLVLLGDVHKLWDTVMVRNALKIPCVYSGSTCMQSIDEAPNKSFLVVQLDKTFTWRREGLTTRPFASFVIHEEPEFLNALEPIAKLAPETLVLVRHSSLIADVAPRLNSVNNKVHYMLRLLPLDSTASTSIEPSDDEAIEQVTLRSCLNSAVDPFKEPKLNGLIAGLLESRDPVGTLAEMKKKVIDGEPGPVAVPPAPAGEVPAP